MKSIKYFLGILLLIIGSTGCNDNFLDTKPYNGMSSSFIFDSDANATLAVNGVYNAMSMKAFYSLFPALMSNLGPDGYEWGRVVCGMPLNTGTATDRDTPIVNLYTNLYRPIIYANDVISGLKDNNKVTETLRNRLIGEAKFIRGLCYFYLYNIWGGVIILDKPTPVTETLLPRNTLENVKEFVVNDFKDAIEKLPVSYSSADLGRVTKGAAIAMLGKCYLYNQQWKEAAEQFAKLLTTPYTYDLVSNFGDSFYWKTQNNKESVFEIQYTMEADLGSAFDQRFGNRAIKGQGEDYCEASATALSVFTNSDGTAIDLSTIPQQTAYASETAYGNALIAWYDKTFAKADLRLHQSVIMPGSTFLGNNNVTYKVYWPYAANVNSTPPALRTTWSTVAVLSVRKFLTLGVESIITAKNGPTNYPLIRFADVLLMYAEALNEANGPTSEVYTALNRIRARAKVVNFPSGLTKETMRREIWLERYRELMFESHLYFDVKRWKVAHTTDPIFGLNNKPELDFRLKPLFTRTFKEDRDYLFPIPGAELDLNDKLEQNPGW